MSSIKEQVLAQQGQYSESDDKYLSVFRKTSHIGKFAEIANAIFLNPLIYCFLGEEMADVLWVLICLANQTGVDLTEELQKSFNKKTQRDAERHKNNPKLSTEQGKDKQ